MTARRLVDAGRMRWSSADSLLAQVSSDRILNAQKEPHNWLTYSGTYMSQRYSQLAQITPANVRDLELKWVFQARWLDYNQATPLVVDGVMYTTQGNDVLALDADHGKDLLDLSATRLQPTRGSAAAASRVAWRFSATRCFLATVDAHLIAIDARSGRRALEHGRGKGAAGYSMTAAPLVIKDKVIVGTAGGEFGIRGFLAAYDAATGKAGVAIQHRAAAGGTRTRDLGGRMEAWRRIDLGDRFLRSGNESHVLGRGKSRARLQRGDAGPATTSTADSVIALDADTGKAEVALPVHRPTTSSTGTPCRFRCWPTFRGKEARARPCCGPIATASSTCSTGRPASSFRRRLSPSRTGTPASTTDGPSARRTRCRAATACSSTRAIRAPRTGSIRRSARARASSTSTCGKTRITSSPAPIRSIRKARRIRRGQLSTNYPGRGIPAGMRAAQRPNLRKEEENYGTVRAFDPQTGKWKWEYKMSDLTDAGILTTASDVLFTGGREGYFFALDARRRLAALEDPAGRPDPEWSDDLLRQRQAIRCGQREQFVVRVRTALICASA